MCIIADGKVFLLQTDLSCMIRTYRDDDDDDVEMAGMPGDARVLGCWGVLTSGIIMMPGLCGNMRSWGVLKLVAVIEHNCMAMPPFVSFTETWKS